MLLAQFGSKAAQGWQPVWFAGMAEARHETGGRSKNALTDLPWGEYASDGYGARRAPPLTNSVRASGRVYCGERHTADEWSRQVRSRVGVKDWLIGYRGTGCRCGTCGPYMRCCQVCGYEQDVQWYARQARLQEAHVSRDNRTEPRSIDTTVPVQMTFEPYSHWQAMCDDRWAWGAPGSLPMLPDDTCNPPSVTEARWPREFPPCAGQPPFRFYRREFTWIQNYCVGYWSAGRWIRATVGESDQQFTHGGEAIIHVPGDTFPVSRLAFTNFQRLTVTICSPTGFESSFTVDEWCGEPQYLLISPYMAPQFRYCPIHDDECINVPTTSTFAQIAQEGEPVDVDSQDTAVLGKLWPGRNIIRFTGMRLPMHPFHYSYDIIPCYL